ncbi:MAG: type II toxin-antitoxin system RelE/ParE family toxin [Dongiaceae bacterium]
MGKWHTVVESSLFAAKAGKRLSELERDGIVDGLARNPWAGAVIPGTHGVRKWRYAVGARGKSGGVRVIYYFYDEGWPVFLLQLYTKKEKADLTAAERNAMGKLAQQLKDSMKRQRSRRDMQ